MIRQPPCWLLDANMLIAMTQAAHVHHADAQAWFEAVPERRWATCALTQLAFVRLSSNPRVVGAATLPSQAMKALAVLAEHPRHEYWPQTPEPLRLSPLTSPALVGHRQVTDAYLLGLAVAAKQRLATLDRGLVSFAKTLGLAGSIELVGAPA